MRVRGSRVVLFPGPANLTAKRLELGPFLLLPGPRLSSFPLGLFLRLLLAQSLLLLLLLLSLCLLTSSLLIRKVPSTRFRNKRLLRWRSREICRMGRWRRNDWRGSLMWRDAPIVEAPSISCRRIPSNAPIRLRLLRAMRRWHGSTMTIRTTCRPRSCNGIPRCRRGQAALRNRRWPWPRTARPAGFFVLTRTDFIPL